MRRMALDLKIIQKVVKRDLRMQSFKRKKVHFLSVLARGKRLVRSKELLFILAQYRRNGGKIALPLIDVNISVKKLIET